MKQLKARQDASLLPPRPFPQHNTDQKLYNHARMREQIAPLSHRKKQSLYCRCFYSCESCWCFNGL